MAVNTAVTYASRGDKLIRVTLCYSVGALIDDFQKPVYCNSSVTCVVESVCMYSDVNSEGSEHSILGPK